ncbi:MAG: cytochrome c1, partial [Alphaproteobacteria bacterium]|nr:cytochrome c1 [Alphaproteobacteria bacterium]
MMIKPFTNLFGGAIFVAILLATPMATQAAEDAKPPKKMERQFSGVLGTYDRNALRRGYQVYKEVCATCHGLKHLYFRNLSQVGGPEFTQAEVKALAAQYQMVEGPDRFGDMFDRAGLPRDGFPEPYPNDNAARAANGGALPPDLSLINKARGHGADYVYALLVGYEDTPTGMEMRAGLYYNPYMPGGRIAMPAPLFEDS